MNQIKFFIPIIAILNICSCSIIKTISLIKGGKVEQKHFYTEIPFENKAGLIAIKANVNGHDGTYIFDTGADISIIQGQLQNLNTKSNVTANVEDINKESSSMKMVKIKSIKINDLNFLNTGGVINGEPLKGDAACLITDGIIGANLAKEAIWQINYLESKIIITDDINKLARSTLNYKIDFETKHSAVPHIFILANNKKHKLIIDTGGNSSFCDINDSSYSKNNVVTMYGTTSAGLFGNGKIDSIVYAKINNISIGTMKFDSVIFEIESDENSLSIPGGALQDNIVTFNWKKNEIWFYKLLNIKREYNTMGLSANIRDNKLFIVKIVDKSCAHKAKIQIGDQIISINGSNYENISEEQYCKLLQQDGGLFGKSNSINLEWLSNGEKKNAILKKEKLL